MIIACPACATRYEVPESAIGANGRTVRCAQCSHSWLAMAGEFDDEEDFGQEDFGEDDLGEEETAEVAPAADDELEGGDVAAVDERPAALPRFRSHPQPALAEEAEAGEREVEEQEPAPVPPARRRARRRMLTWAAMIFAVLAGGTIAAASYWGPPDWMPVSGPTFAAAHPSLKLDFPPERQERRQLPNGTEFFGASGTITNLDREAKNVPPILIVLRDGRDRIVYSWEVAPPKRSLAPGESVTVREAITDVPRSARVAEIGWKPV